MINCADFFEALQAQGVSHFTGVPDSLLKDIGAFINDHTDESSHVIAANEGGAIALAMGYHLATGKLALVYLQNSGLGNIVNPLTSLADPEIYSIPMLLLIGWRGEPGEDDEPQHRKQGRITLEMLQALEIPHAILPENSVEAKECVVRGVAEARKRGGAYALVVRKGTFGKYAPSRLLASRYPMSREQVIELMLAAMDPSDVVVSTTGMASREVFEYRARNGGDHSRDFLTVGGMGHASQIALGLARARPERKIYCIDGDGAWIMHMGSAAIVGAHRVGNFRHLVINNGAHDSVGGQPTAGFSIDLPAIARSCGYSFALQVGTVADFQTALPEFCRGPGPVLLEARVRRGARADLGRPTQTPLQNKMDFMRKLGV